MLYTQDISFRVGYINSLNCPLAGCSFNLHTNDIFLSHQKIADRSRALLPSAQKDRKQVSGYRGALRGWGWGLG